MNNELGGAGGGADFLEFPEGTDFLDFPGWGGGWGVWVGVWGEMFRGWAIKWRGGRYWEYERR